MRNVFHHFHIPQPSKPRNPLLKLVFAILGVFVLFGVCVFAVFVGAMMILANAFFRLINKKPVQAQNNSSVIDAEYTVIK